MRFGEFLLNKQMIDAEALSDALDIQRFRKKRIGRLLRDLGYLDQAQLNRALHLFLKREINHSVQDLASGLKRDLDGWRFSLPLLAWAEERGVILLEENASHLVFLATEMRDEISERGELELGKACELRVIGSEAFRYVRAYCGFDTQGERESREAHPVKPMVLGSQDLDSVKMEAHCPYAALFHDMILAARDMKASDIHIQPECESLEIRFRVHGVLQKWKRLSLDHRRPFIQEVKKLTNLSIAISGRAQDGRISFKAWKLDLRASLLPSQYGEKIVLRLLDLSRQFDLMALGFDTETYHDLTDALRSQNGVLIISGPTGSGKTTTLYTLLCALDRAKRNIITLEDPIEYGIEGLTQVQISRKLSFADALRSVLRQDPDVILVGEIRDAETADLCVKAASTGHLVLSTLHANGAPEVVTRLMNLGVEPYLLKSVLRFSAAQRLVKRLCPKCSVPAQAEAEQLLMERLEGACFRMGIGRDFRRRNPEGCPDCQEGIIGRVPVLEYMREGQIRRLLAGVEATEPEETVSLQESILRRAEKGEVDYHDVLEIE